ncbi:putative efflux pump antibiotic resistance protein [Rosellinia necatrix]|uniref:Putative efflux pump antibiotic resistance protein n=1 Tax=Rosellinia necatrix TaxID=77044 RepID=A0A1W2TBK2_ROSNE|nr:putative efflux pump antibiotic resistance protein [Rosellinia necatrix]
MADSEAHSGDGLKIIHASLFRMATKSMSQAYEILGFKVNHALLLSTMETKWNAIEEAAEATWPTVPGARARPPFARADWDALWGAEWDVVTDIASPFVPELIRAYPSARVVIVQRDFEGWWPSFARNVRDRVFAQPRSTITGLVTTWFLGIRVTQAMRKMLFGFFGVGSARAMDAARARAAYDDYFRAVRALVPADRRLEYRVGDGWEPLCDFLGVDVPHGVPFPRGNDGAALDKVANSRYREYFVLAAKVAGGTVVGRVLAGCACGWAVYRWLRK